MILLSIIYNQTLTADALTVNNNHKVIVAYYMFGSRLMQQVLRRILSKKFEVDLYVRSTCSPELTSLIDR